MNLGTNLLNSITGNVDKAILCVKKPAPAKVGGRLDVSASMSNVDLQAKLANIGKKGMFSFGSQAETIAKAGGYHILKVKYNPSKIQFDSRAAGSIIQPGPGGAGTNTLSQITMPAQTYMNFELLFDQENHQDAFMFEKATNLSAGALVSDAAGVVKNLTGDGYTVRPEVEAFLGLLTQSETRQVVFYWSEMAFAGEVVSVDARYTMFNTQGNPIRAVVRLTIMEGGQDKGSGSMNKYWNDAFDKLGSGGSGIAGKVGNLLNLN